MSRSYLGIDTSNYTTSLALYCGETGQIRQEKQPLPVEAGQLGLRQSDAVFHHVKQLPPLAEALLQGEGVVAVGASTRPRDVERSYMPCFLAGEMAGRAIAAALHIPFYGFSHQAGHLAAALLGADALALMGRSFLAFHVSGGTTECLLVSPGEDTPFSIRQIGRTLDLNAGQVIDRVGGMLGLPFPAGPHLEKLAEQGGKAPGKAVLKGFDCCLSGLENQCRTLLKQGASAAETARFCQASVGRTILEMALAAKEEHWKLPFLFAGGVMSNKGIREQIQSKIPGALFAPPALSADNAAGIALLTCKSHQKEAPC